MRIDDITPNHDLNEAPANMFKQGLRRLGAKAAGAVGMKGVAAGLTGAADTGKEANELKAGLKGYVGSIGGDMNKLDAGQLSAFLKSKKMPTDGVPAAGVVPQKQVDDIILKAVQASKKLGAGGDAANAATASGGAGGKAGAGGQGGAGGAGAPGAQGAANAATASGGVQGNTPAAAPTAAANAGASSIPPELQSQLDALTPTEKKALAGLI